MPVAVTDNSLIKELEKQKIDPNFVSFTQDYAPRSLGKVHSPYAKFYKDFKSNKGFMVVSGLPMVHPAGGRIQPFWASHLSKNFKQETNLFEAVTNKRQINLTCLCDQPTGVKKFEQVYWRPQLFLNGIEVNPTKEYPDLLEVDPTNENYQFNTLEWDYGVCKRRIRLIEGRLRERWIFYSNPKADVRIKHNFKGKGVKLGSAFGADRESLHAVVVGDEELITSAEFANAVYPVNIAASATYYPDADAESTSIDGQIVYEGGSQTWASLIAQASGTEVHDSNNELVNAYARGSTTNNEFDRMRRTIALFDTSGLPDNATKSATTLSFYGVVGNDDLSASPDVQVYSSNPASNTALATGDFDSLGTTAFCDSAIDYASWNTDGWNDFTFNSTGIAAIPTDGVAKFGTRESQYEVAESAPPWVSGKTYQVGSYSADQGEGYKPKLVVTYTVVTRIPQHGFVNFQDPAIV